MSAYPGLKKMFEDREFSKREFLSTSLDRIDYDREQFEKTLEGFGADLAEVYDYDFSRAFDDLDIITMTGRLSGEEMGKILNATVHAIQAHEGVNDESEAAEDDELPEIGLIGYHGRSE